MPEPRSLDRPLLLRGPLWVGDGAEHADGVLVVGVDGSVVACGSRDDVDVPDDAIVVDAGWIGPGVVDHHVHLAFGDPQQMLAGGVVAVRDLGAPPADAVRWRRLAAPRVEVAGPLLTAPGGYPSQSWGRSGFAAFVDDPGQATRLVEGLAGQVDVIKLALEPRGGAVPEPDVASAVVAAAHAAGKAVTAHALSLAMVERALDAGVDELAHMPIDVLPGELVDRMAASGTRVVSTMQTLLRDSSTGGVLVNAKALVAAGVDVR
ncbi:MAG TPA: amidohydrolase family protein, partial [Mycobacteriales bacterium]|nr:amidohydrolase family protein [Mycobacteriales bacterium]